jgi:hypothetical protein
MTDPGASDLVPHVPSGLAAFDNDLGGGYPAGSLVAISAPPESPAELFCEAAVSSSDFPGIYLSTVRAASTVDEAIETGESVIEVGSGDAEVHTFSASPFGSLGQLSEVPTSVRPSLLCLPDRSADTQATTTERGDTEGLPTPDGDSAVAHALRAALDGSQPTIAVDAFSDFLHRDDSLPDSDSPTPGWLRLLRWLYLTVKGTDGLGIILLQSDTEGGRSAAERLVLRVADAHIHYTPGEETDRLRLTKLRGFNAAAAEFDSLPYTVGLNIGESISADPDQKV